MARSTIEQAFALARSGQVPDVARLKSRLKAEGCRAVDALLAQRNLNRHLEAICTATFKPAPSDSTAPFGRALNASRIEAGEGSQ